MCRSWYSGVDLLEFHGQSKLFSHIYFLCFLGNHSSAAPEKKKKNFFFGKILQNLIIFIEFCSDFDENFSEFRQIFVENVEHS